MKTLSLTKETAYPVLLESIIVLKNGGIIAAPSDTVYGLIADATNKEAIAKLFSLKARKTDKPMPVFIDSFKMLDDVAYIKEEKIARILKEFWPGKLTCVLPSRGWMPIEIRGGGGLNIGIRMPKHEFLLSLIKGFGKPLAETSANVSGRVSRSQIKDVIDDFKHLPIKPDLIIDAGDLPESKPSTVIDLTKNPPEIIREGAMPNEEILKAL